MDIIAPGFEDAVDAYDPCRAIRLTSFHLNSVAIDVARSDTRGDANKFALQGTGLTFRLDSFPFAAGEFGEIFHAELALESATDPKAQAIVVKVLRPEDEGEDSMSIDSDSGEDEDAHAAALKHRKEYYIHAVLYCLQRDGALNKGKAKIPRILFIGKLLESTNVHFIGMERLQTTLRAHIDGDAAHIDGKKNDDLKRWANFASVLKQLCKLLQQCQEERAFVHGDLHLGNVMVGARGEAYLIDFGLSSMRDPLDSSRRIFVDPDMRAFNPSLDLLVFLTSVLNNEVRYGRAVGLTILGRKMTVDDFAANRGAGVPLSRIARFCHAVIEPFYDAILEWPKRKQKPATTAAEKNMRSISRFIHRKVLSENYYTLHRPLKELKQRQHALYFDKCSSLNYEPTHPDAVLRAVREFRMPVQTSRLFGGGGTIVDGPRGAGFKQKLLDWNRRASNDPKARARADLGLPRMRNGNVLQKYALKGELEVFDKSSARYRRIRDAPRFRPHQFYPGTELEGRDGNWYRVVPGRKPNTFAWRRLRVPRALRPIKNKFLK